jgi:hypothetical protein
VAMASARIVLTAVLCMHYNAAPKWPTPSRAMRSSQFEACAKDMGDLVGPPLETDRIRWCRNDSGHPAVSVVSANSDFHAGNVDLLSDHACELLGSAALFHHGGLHPGRCPARRGVVELTRRGHSTWVWGGPRRQIAADSCRVEGVRKAKPLPKAFGRGVQVDGVRLGGTGRTLTRCHPKDPSVIKASLRATGKFK